MPVSVEIGFLFSDSLLNHIKWQRNQPQGEDNECIDYMHFPFTFGDNYIALSQTENELASS